MTQKFEYKGYTLVQELTVNYHYMIFNNSTGKMMMHASCTEKIRNQSEAEELIENYLSFVKNDLPRLLEDEDEIKKSGGAVGE